MSPSGGRPGTYVFELVLALLVMVLLLTGLCGVLWRRRRGFSRGRIVGGWKKLWRRFLLFSAANDEDRGVKRGVTDVEQAGVDDSGDVEADKGFSDEEEEELADYMLATGLVGLQSRILFTIMEESKEDLDSDCGRSLRRELSSKRLSITRSLSDLGSCSSRRVFESILPTPPSRFKFLRDAEEKFRMRLKMEAEERARHPLQVALSTKDDSWLKMSDLPPQTVQNHPSCSSRVIPLEFSPP